MLYILTGLCGQESVVIFVLTIYGKMHYKILTKSFTFLPLKAYKIFKKILHFDAVFAPASFMFLKLITQAPNFLTSILSLNNNQLFVSDL